MAVDHIRYDILAQEALRGVVRTVLDDAAKNGLPGDHHFYITFDTHAEGVRLPPRLLAQFPEEMTIVLQHQFWDLTVDEAAFEVGMSFGGIPERICIPFAAIKGFVDPSVQFGVKFENLAENAAEAHPPADAAAPAKRGHAKSARPGAAHKQTRTTPEIPAVPKPANPQTETPPDNGPTRPAGGAEVVRLDRFRKK
jgi:hypothetical protein